MNDIPRGRGRPKKHLADEHHYKHETLDNDATAVATPVASDASQADAKDETEVSDSASAVLYNVSEEFVEAVVESPEVVESVIPVTIYPPEESPVEQKIKELVESNQERMKKELTELLYSDNINGWQSLDTEIITKLPPRNGMPVRISETPDGDGVLAFWKRTRAFANPTHRWVETGKWVDWFSSMDIKFVPKYWKERNV